MFISSNREEKQVSSNFFFFQFSFFLAAQELETIKKQYVKIADAYGCLGVLQVNVGESPALYLVIVTGCFSVGKLCDAEIFRITQTQFVPLQFQPPGEDKISEVCDEEFNRLTSVYQQIIMK